MAPGIGNLKSLRHLSRFAVGLELQCGLRELKDLKLHDKLCIMKLEKLVSVHDAEAANLKGKQYIDSLMLRWSDAAFRKSVNVSEEDMIDQLQPHENLKHLSVENYNGKEFSNWIKEPSFKKLKIMTLVNCKMCSSFSYGWNLPSLKMLQLKSLHGVKSFGIVHSGFKDLETLDVSDMLEMESWFLGDGMNHLTAPCIVDCLNLRWLYLPLEKLLHPALQSTS